VISVERDNMINQQRKTSCSGFTLVELMIVVVVISVLAAIALPSYLDSVRKSRRADAKTALVQLAQFMERNYSLAQRYDQDSAGAPIALPFTQAPVDSPTKYYTLSLNSIARDTFTLWAKPIPGTSQASDVCLTLTLDNAGARKTVVDDAGTAGTRTDCW